MLKLIIRGIAHKLAGDRVTIGRAPDNVIVLSDVSVSAHHAELRLTGESYLLKDLGSTNGTRVNGILITESLLHVEDRIGFGAVEARFESDVRGSQPLPALQEIAAKPAEFSTKPIDFRNASPLPRRGEQQRDRFRIALVVVAAIALVTFVASMIAVVIMQAP